MNPYIKLNRLEYVITYQCLSRCRHCFITDEQPNNPKHLDAALAVQVLREVAQHHALTSVMTFGGEPLLYPEVVCAIQHEATRLNIPSRQIITNGYWSKDEQKTRAIAIAVARAGVNQIAFSVDAFHQEYVPIEQVKLAAAALLAAGIRNIAWNPCWLVSENDDNVYNLKTRAILQELRDLPIAASWGNVMEPRGHALTELNSYFQKTFAWSKTSCQDIPYMDKLDDLRSISVNPNGDIPLCSAFMLGNAARQNVTAILESYNPYADPEMKAFLEHGINGLICQAQKLGIGLNQEGYYSICDLCTSVRHHEKWTEYRIQQLRTFPANHPV